MLFHSEHSAASGPRRLFRAVIRRLGWHWRLAVIRWAYWWARRLPGAPTADFVCLICGRRRRVPAQALSREGSSCAVCGSSVRYRAVVRALLIGLECTPSPLAHQPARPGLAGLGLTDSPIYARRLRRLFAYTNTFYHKEPKLDVMAPHPRHERYADFIVCSDVLEHVRPPISRAFESLFRLLKPGGLLVLSVPLAPDRLAREFYPTLHAYRVESRGDSRVLVNQTATGDHEEFTAPLFHAGEGETLVMRSFSRAWLRAELARAGFGPVRFMDGDCPEYGIVWRQTQSVPVLAWRPRQDKEDADATLL